MRGKWSTATVVAVLSLLSVMVLVSAECPNGCSGAGDCMAKDMCNCYKNYQGNDCADRTCPFGRAHVDTPKGDINMDKDRLTVGYVLTDSQQDPAGTHEYFNPDAAADEAHFYMECSNKGICDRSTGLCTCFDGYEGAGCRRTTCPGKCNGHGTCESIRELGVKAAGTLFGLKGRSGAVKYDLWDGNSTYGCRCDPWYHGPDCSKRSCKVGVDPLYLGVGVPVYETFVVHAGTSAALDAASWIRLRLFDYHGESYITKKIPVTKGATAVVGGTIVTAQDVIDATAANQAAAEKANAAAVAAAIMAVPNLTFSKVTCAPQGVAPFDTFKSVRTEAVAAAANGMSVVCQFSDNPGKMRIPEIAASNGFTADGFVKVVTIAQQGADEDWFTLQSGEMPTTVTVGAFGVTTVLTSAATTTSIAVSQLIKIEDNIVLVKSKTGKTLTLEFPFIQVVSATSPIFVAAAGQHTVGSGTAIVVDALVGADSFSFAAATAAEKFAPGDLLFFHNQFFTVQSFASDGTNMVVKLDKPFGGNSWDGKKVAATALVYKVATAGQQTLDLGTVITADVADQATTITAVGACTAFAAGDLLYFQKQFFTMVSCATDVATLNTKYVGATVTAASNARVYKVSTSNADKNLVYKYVSECSGRGMCGYETGICTCFKGYTDDNCDTQNILAV